MKPGVLFFREDWTATWTVRLSFGSLDGIVTSVCSPPGMRPARRWAKEGNWVEFGGTNLGLSLPVLDCLPV